MNNPDNPPLKPLSASAGQCLAAARQAQNFSVKDVAQRLNLATATIQALERDDYQHLPGSTFIKGYLRAYARLLNLESEEIVQSVNLAPEEMGEIRASKRSLMHRRRRGPRKRGGWWRRIALFLAALAILMWAMLVQWPDWRANLDVDEIIAQSLSLVDAVFAPTQK